MCKADKNIGILSKIMYDNAKCNIMRTIAEANMKKRLNASTLKLIAIITISRGFFDFYSWQGYMLHIRKKYILRMTFFAAVSVVPFYLFFHEEYAYRQNIIFDYLLALLLLTVLESKKHGKPAKVMLSILLAVTSLVIGGWPIMPMVYVLIFYYADYYADSFKKQAVWFCSSTVCLVMFIMIAITLNTKYNFYPMYSSWVWWDKSYFLGFMLALPLLKMYNGEKGEYPLGRYFFFIFYPAHFLVLFASKEIIKFYGSYWLYVGLQLFCMALIIFFMIRIMMVKSSKAQNAAVILVHTSEYNHIFYKDISMDNSWDFPRLVLDYGIGFIVFFIFLMAIFFAAGVQMIRSYKKASEVERKRISLLLIGMCFPWLVVVIRSMGLTGGYEISFLGIIFTAVFAMLALIKYGYFDSVHQAVTNVIYKSNEGLPVLDNDKNVLYYNSIIKRIFPEIAERQSVSTVPVLCDTKVSSF